jgi:hypothetical protein
VRRNARALTSIVAALLVASTGVTAFAARCASCTAAPCCAVKDSAQAHLMARMPCCASSTRAEPVARTVVAVDDALLFLAPARVAGVSPAVLAARTAERPRVVRHVRPLYQSKCSLLL